MEITETSFKREGEYRCVLEHVTDDFGRQYLECIQKEFAYVKVEHIIEYIKRNDSIGNPHLADFSVGFDPNPIITFQGSPSSVRYIYHALLILETIRNHDNKNLRRIVELGCGYGGLFFAIKFFRDLYFQDVLIEHYYFIDFSQVLTLISNYLKANQMHDLIPLSFIDTVTFNGDEINNNTKDLFLVSNYCFTELSPDLRDKYFEKLISRVSGGFIIWQSIVTPLSDVDRLPFPATHVEETPQTSPSSPNYFVRF